MDTLAKLHADIDARVHAIRSDYPDWLCRKGCDNCCRRLAEVPLLTAAEWNYLQEGLATLPPDQLQEISQAIAALAGQLPRPIVCPLLNRSAGACRVYAHRPVACRTYGFFVQRFQGLYCKDIEAQTASGALAEAVWGNQDAIDRRLNNMGDTRELTAWFACWMNGGDMTF